MSGGHYLGYGRVFDPEWEGADGEFEEPVPDPDWTYLNRFQVELDDRYTGLPPGALADMDQATAEYRHALVRHAGVDMNDPRIVHAFGVILADLLMEAQRLVADDDTDIDLVDFILTYAYLFRSAERGLMR